MKIAAIILAAGRSTRFEGGHKLLADFEGRSVIHHVIATISGAPVDDIILVTSPDGGKIVAAAGPGRWQSAVNPDASLGLASSIQTGIARIAPEVDGALIVLADMPGVTGELIDRLVTAFNDSEGTVIAFPQSPDGIQGNPVLWPRDLFTELMALRGDVGGKAVLNRYPNRQRPISVGTTRVLADIDTREDLARITSKSS